MLNDESHSTFNILHSTFNIHVLLQLAQCRLNPSNALPDAIHRRGVADADVVVRAESDAGHDRDARLLQKELGERVRISNGSLSEQPMDLREEVEGAVGVGAAQSFNAIDRRN